MGLDCRIITHHPYCSSDTLIFYMEKTINNQTNLEQ